MVYVVHNKQAEFDYMRQLKSVRADFRDNIIRNYASSAWGASGNCAWMPMWNPKVKPSALTSIVTPG